MTFLHSSPLKILLFPSQEKSEIKLQFINKTLIKQISMNQNNINGSGSMTVISQSERLNYREIVYMYYQDPYKNGNFTLNIDYNMESDSGESLDGTCITDLQDVLEAIGKSNYKELKEYMVDHYRFNEDAWNSIIEDFKNLGLKLIYDESN